MVVALLTPVTTTISAPIRSASPAAMNAVLLTVNVVLPSPAAVTIARVPPALIAGLPPGYGTAPVQSSGFETIPLNGKGGRLDGIELTASAPGELLTDWLQGFGAIVSVSQTDSSIRVQGAVAGADTQNIPLPGLSKTVWNATVYFEKYGFSARVATRYRSNYIGEITDFSGSRALEYVRHEQITDLQTSYEFQKAPLLGLSLLFQVNNLTNTPFIDYATETHRIRDYETFGRDFFFGFNYKM